MPPTCHRHFTPSSPDGSNVPGVPYRKTCVNCFQSFKAGFCAECRGFVAFKRLKENKHATHVDVNGKEMCPQKRKDGGKFATGSQRASRQKIKQDRFDQLAPRRLLRLGSTTPASQWNGRMVLAKNPFKMQEENPPWETLHEVSVCQCFQPTYKIFLLHLLKSLFHLSICREMMAHCCVTHAHTLFLLLCYRITCVL